LGMEAVERRCLGLSEYLWSRLNDCGKQMYTPPGTRSQVVSFYERHASELARRLMDKKVKVTGREVHGGHIRVSPHFYNNRDYVDTLIEKLKKLI
jgi:selenocysteine lyase/cysteine desulfurase